ncbi:type II secretion system F family protein [Demequina sp.]|uniref:type II secretion system F family protein n=1 Tax=Demequina sp. TaxID=2050685 RepID=UPI003D0D65B4
MADAVDELVDAASVVGMLRAGLSPGDAFEAVGWGQVGEDGAAAGAAPEFAVAARLSHATGAPLAPVLEACAAALREEAEAALARDVALAGPRLSARVLAWLPAVGLGLAVLVDTSVLAVLGSPVGVALVGVGAALTLAGRCWMRRLVARASPAPDPTGVSLHAVRAAMAAGADVASALAAVGLAMTPEKRFWAAGERLQAVALALSGGEAWAAAWVGGPEPLERALRLAWERGSHAAPMLLAVASGEDLRRRRAAQVAAGELSVRLTIPLALCLLPAFVVVGIVPLLVALIGGLR